MSEQREEVMLLLADSPVSMYSLSTGPLKMSSFPGTTSPLPTGTVDATQSEMLQHGQRRCNTGCATAARAVPLLQGRVPRATRAAPLHTSYGVQAALKAA